MSLVACIFGFHDKIKIKSYEQHYATHNGKFLGETVLETEKCKCCERVFNTQEINFNKKPHNGVYNF